MLQRDHSSHSQEPVGDSGYPKKGQFVKLMGVSQYLVTCFLGRVVASRHNRDF